MLFGPESLQQGFVDDMKGFCAKEEVQPVFASILSSVAIGFQNQASDLDARGLYMNLENSRTRYAPMEHDEKCLRKRFYPECEKSYDWIGMWEYTSFFQFLATPSFCNDFSVGLYRNVPSSLYSPYVWDPHGIVQKIDPLVRACYNPKYMVQACFQDFQRYYYGVKKDYFHKPTEERAFDPSDDMIPTGYYLKAIYEVVALDWMLEHNTFHPWYFKTLTPVLSNAVKDEILSLVHYATEKRHTLLQTNKTMTGLDMLYFVQVKKNPIISEYIQSVEDKMNARDDIANFKSKETVQETVDHILDIIEYSIHDEIQIQDRFQFNREGD